MFKKKSTLPIVLVLVLILSNTIVFAQEALPDQGIDLSASPSIPERNASSWALNELVDSDRYGIYQVKELYQNDLRSQLSEDLRRSLLENLDQRLENSGLETRDNQEYLAEVTNGKTRGGFLRQVYNAMIPYEKEENLGKDPIMYLNHIGIVTGNGSELFLDRNTTIEEGVVFIKRAVDYIYSENKLDSQGLMWKVENQGNTAYLLGSIHYGKPGLYPFRDEIIDNFLESEALYVEVDITNQEEMIEVMMEMLTKFEEEMEKASKYEDDTTLKSVIGEELYSKVEAIMEKYHVSEEEYERLTIIGLEQKLNEIIIEDAFGNLSEEDEMELENALEDMEDLFDSELMELLLEGPNYGVDFYFLDKAKTLNKEVGELESIQSQLDILFGGGIFQDSFGNISEEEQIESLKILLESFDDAGNIVEVEGLEDEGIDHDLDEDLEKEIEEALEGQVDLIEGMFDAIINGDAEKLAQLFVEADGVEMLGGQLLGERDKEMAKKIGDLLESDEENTYFIVVGAAHFVVDGTIIDNLENMGYEVERIK